MSLSPTPSSSDGFTETPKPDPGIAKTTQQLVATAQQLLKTRKKHIILCCDCEGTRRQLERMANVIDRVGVAANYFFVGETAKEFPDLVRDIASRHQSESHTMDHLNLRKNPKEVQRRTIMMGKETVERTIGRPTRGFRAPYHAINRQTIEILNEEGFVFDASGLYYRYDTKGVEELVPTWFREWMPLYETLGLSPHRTFGIFRQLVKWRRVTLLPAHPHYSGLDERLAAGFEEFLRWAVEDQEAVFWPIDLWLHVTRNVELPQWVAPFGQEVKNG